MLELIHTKIRIHPRLHIFYCILFDIQNFEISPKKKQVN
jgi:hypothetical protein